MNKKISSEFAIGIILLASIMTAGIFLMLEKKQSFELQYALQADIAAMSKVRKTNINVSRVKKDMYENAVAECKPRYYEGEAEVRGWLSEDSNNRQSLNVRIKKEDIEKLPTTKVDSLNANFITTLIDPTEEVSNDLRNASEKNPAAITVHGFAQVCEDSPQVSMKQATIAFKKG